MRLGHGRAASGYTATEVLRPEHEELTNGLDAHSVVEAVGTQWGRSFARSRAIFDLPDAGNGTRYDPVTAGEYVLLRAAEAGLP
jgi:hypothetical protein